MTKSLSPRSDDPSHSVSQEDLLFGSSSTNGKTAVERTALQLGHECLAQGNLEDAVQHYHQVLRLNPTSIEGYQSLAEAFNSQGRLEEAASCYRRAIELLSSSSAEVVDSIHHLSIPLNLSKNLSHVIEVEQLQALLEQAEAALAAKQWNVVVDCCEQLLELQPSAKTYKLLGNALQAKGNVDAALKAYTEALQIQPGWAEVYANLGSLKAQQEQWQSAIDHYQQAISLKPTFAGAYRNLARIWTQLNQPDQAKQCWYQAFTLEPEKATPEAHFDLGNQLLEQGDQSAAIVCYRHAIAQDPNFSAAYQNLAVALNQIQLASSPQPSGSARSFSERSAQSVVGQSQQARPNSAEQWVDLGTTYAEQQQWEKAKACYQEALQLDPKQAAAHWNLSEVWESLQNPIAAAESMYQAVSLEPTWATPAEHLSLGHRLFQSDRLDLASDCYLRVTQFSPDNAEAAAGMGAILTRKGQLSAAVVYYRRAIELDSKQLAYYRSIGQILTQLKDWPQVQDCYRQLIQLEPANPQNYIAYAEAATQQGQIASALQSYRQLVALQPASWEAHHKMGDLLAQQQQWEAAIESFQRSIDLNPQFSWSQNNLGDALLHLERWQESAEAFERAISLNSEFHWSHYNLGEACTQLGRWETAVTAYRKALALNPDLPRLQQKLGFALRHQGEVLLIEALNCYRRAIDQDPDDVQNYHQAIDLSPDDVGLYNGLVNAFSRQGDTIGATVFQEISQQIQEKDSTGTKEFSQLAEKKNLELNLRIQEGNGGQNLFSQVILPSETDGRLETWEGGRIRGWALPNNDSSAACLDVYLDDIFFKTIKADLARPDLLRHGIGNGNNGFETSIPLYLIQRSGSKVDIFWSRTESRLKKSPAVIELSQEELQKYRDPKIRQFTTTAKLISNKQHAHGITIIIPIRDAFNEVCECIQSVLEYTSISARLLLINDASTDNRIVSLLQWAETFANVEVIHNPVNLGYTTTINVGIERAGNDDVVLLNSDTIVGPRWLQNLRIAAYHEIDIGTVTAISDNAGAFSVPEIGVANEMPVWLNVAELARAISHHSQSIYPEVPTGSGFCLYIRRALLHEIGLFDDVAFPRGYGEENDFCMRALRAGWRHVVDDRTLVRHVRSASFKGEKQALNQAGRKVVDERYPEYGSLTPIFSRSSDLHAVRYNVRKVLGGSTQIQQRVLPRVLYVISTQTGGTPRTNEDLMQGLGGRYHTMMLRCDSKEITLYDTSCEPHMICETFRLQTPISLATHRSTEYDKIVGGLLVKYSIELLHVRHLAWHSLSLPWIAKQLGIPVIFSFHDFYAICPTVNLLDENRVFCGGHCTETKGQCEVLLWPKGEVPPLKRHFVKTWQMMMAEVLQSVDAVITTADSAKEQIQAIYPFLKETPFHVIPHGRDFLDLEQGITQPEQILSPSQPMRILFPGNINMHKGAEIIAKLQHLNIEKRFELHFLGTTDKVLVGVGQHHGTYRRSDYSKLVQKIRPHYIGIFSIWPETYCHTLTESWATGVPVIAIDQGAVGDRIREHSGGWLLDTTDPAEIYARLLEIANDVEGYSQKVAEVCHWQQFYGRQNNISTMAASYHELYQQVLARVRPFQPPLPGTRFESIQLSQRLVKVGVFIQRDRQNQANPSTHIRVLEWMQHPNVSPSIDAQLLEVDAFLQDKHQVFDIDMVLVQRNVIKPHLVQQFIQNCRQRNLPIVFELDDDLINVPPDKDPDQFYSRAAGAIEQMVRAAATVVVSTKPLADRMRKLNSNVVVVPNTISEYVWFAPIKKIEHLPVEMLEAEKEQLKVVYMGNPTHSQDLAMVRPVFERLRREGYAVTLFVIGGELEDEAAGDWYQRLVVPPEYRHYPEFVKWFRTLAAHFDVAIAPLVETEFNRCKSALKFLQYGAVGLLGVYSDCVPYREMVNHGGDGFLVENREEVWYQAILGCVEIKGFLPQLGQAAQQVVMEKHLMNHYAEAYARVFAMMMPN